MIGSVFANVIEQDDNVQHSIHCPTAPTRLDKDIGNNVDINMNLFKQLLSFSKDGQAFSLEDLAEHHHLRHDQSRAESPRWQFGNSDATCALLDAPVLLVLSHSIYSLQGSIHDSRRNTGPQRQIWTPDALR